MDIEGRLHTEQRRSHKTMMISLRKSVSLSFAGVTLAALLASLPLHAQTVTGPQTLTFAGLRSVANQGQVNAVASDAAGNLFLLLDQKDGVRILKTDATASTVLAQSILGAKGDIGLALALDPSGNVYITGTTTSGSLAGTSGAAFPTVADTSTNSFVAKYDTGLNNLFVTLCGSGRLASVSIAATADAAFVTGSLFAATLPVTPAGIIQVPAYNSTQNGFVEKFSADGKTLLYATYLSGANGTTSPAAIVADTSDNAYIAGYTSSPGYPTVAAVVPNVIGTTTGSGFLTKLTPAGDGLTFSTYIPGGGISSLAIDASAKNLLLSGNVALGQFPVASVATPIANTTYQTLLRMPLDGSSVLASTLLAPGSQSFVAAGPSGTAWVNGTLSLPLLPLTPLSPIGNSFAVRVNASNAIDQTARFGGLASTNPTYAAVPVNFTSLALDPTGQPIFAGSATPYASSSLLSTQTYDLPLRNPTTPALPSTIRNTVLAASACTSGQCTGSAAYLARITAAASAASAIPSLVLSTDDSPNLTLRNLGSALASSLAISATGFTQANNCGSSLAAGAECSVALTGSGPGSITVTSSNAATQTATLPAITSTAVAVVFSPKELDFGLVTSSSPVARTLTVTNLGSTSQTFTSALLTSPKITLPYTFAETASDCTTSGLATTKLLAPGGVCHITVSLTASSTATNDGTISAQWTLGARTVPLTAIAQAAALTVSSSEVDFGTQYTGGLRLPRFLYLSNASASTIAHASTSLPASSPFTLVDRCPSTLEPQSVCQLQLNYASAKTPSSDSVTLALDQGLNVLVTGQSLPSPSVGGASANPSLSVSASALTFPTAVAVTAVSTSTQTLTITNTGASAFALAFTLTGDFTDTSSCPTSLAGGASCTLVLTFVPSQPGTRSGLISLTAGAATAPTYVNVTGTGTGILSPANNGTLSFGSVFTGQPSVQWIKVTQSFPAFTAVTTGAAFGAVLVEDIGYGHGQPPISAFTSSASGTCFNCWLGVQFLSTATGPQTGSVTLTSTVAGSSYTLALTGTGLPLTGLLLTPTTQDFGSVAVNSSSTSALFSVTNLVPGGASVTLATPTLTGDFLASTDTSGGATCGGPLAYTASCFIEVVFAPSATGQRTGTLTVAAGTTAASAALTGFATPDPGLSLSPTALVFNNVPGSAAGQQSITLANTSGATLLIGTPAASTTGATSSSFSESTICGSLAAGATCSIAVTFTPATGPVAGTLQIPVTSTLAGTASLTTYTVPLTGAYTSESAGLQLIASQSEYGPQAAGAPGTTRQITIDNLTAKSVTLNIALPRQFVLAGTPCSGLAPNASCTFAVTFLPVTNGDIPGTLFATGTPSDGSASLNGIGYVEGYGIGAGSLSITGGLSPGNVLSFGSIASGTSTAKTLTLTNSGTLPVTIHRITSQWPFLSTSTCGATLTAEQTCTVTLTYTPINQVSTSVSSPASTTDTGVLTIESDALSSPDLINLTGIGNPIASAAPSNAAPLALFTASQSSLTFPATSIGNLSVAQTVTLNNIGTAAIHVAGLQTSTDFTSSTTCATLNPGTSCNVTVTFVPQAGSRLHPHRHPRDRL